MLQYRYINFLKAYFPHDVDVYSAASLFQSLFSLHTTWSTLEPTSTPAPVYLWASILDLRVSNFPILSWSVYHKAFFGSETSESVKVSLSDVLNLWLHWACASAWICTSSYDIQVWDVLVYAGSVGIVSSRVG